MTLPGGTRARVVEAGPPDAPPVVLVHGWACSAFAWRHVLSPLAAHGHRVLALDLKGHGFSDKPPLAAEYSANAMSRFVLDVMDACEVGHAALVGHSMGGAICAGVALLEPARVTHLGLLSPVGFGRVYGLPAVRLFSPEATLGLLPYLAPRWAVGTILRLTFGAPVPSLTPEDVDEYWAPTQFAEYSVALRHLLHVFDWVPHAEERLRRLTVPVLVMFGTRDRVVVPQRAAELVRHLPHGHLELVRGGGHMLLEEAPQTVTAAIEALLADRGASED